MNRWPVKPPPPRPDGLDKKPNHDWYKKWEEKKEEERQEQRERNEKKKQSEFYTVQRRAVSLYENKIKKKFPHSLLIVDPFADMYFGKSKIYGSNMSIGEFVMSHARNRGWQRGYPDFTIVQQRGQYAGISLEFKKAGVTVFKQNGELRKDDHLQEQYDVLQRYEKQGYFARFSIGWEQTEKYLLNYFGL